MRMKNKALATGVALALAGNVVQAQEGWSGGLEAGVNLVSGNTDEKTITSQMDVTRDWSEWRQNVLFNTRYSEQDGQRTAERYQAATQLDYKFTDHDYVFVRGRYDDDSFDGFEFQASVTAGYGRRLWSLDENYFDLSVGGGYRYSRFEQPDPEDGRRREEPIGRLAGDFRYRLAPTATFQQKAETEIGLDNSEYVARSVTSLQANLMASLALRLSYTVERESDVPEGTKNTDTITSLNLLYSF